ncbi:hypothetical protein PC118_g19340 [Phytophthora cactorum]|uniref:Uncharacterized protein n=1 Tax=Phytophthora cactorum TaxID=29920 RepID=A0A8T1AZV1_9STRA|nr:hypothetical protein PC112_g19725 [Phytophthora cactorum]KAG2802912.1 hypothetical protein PC111_g18903 [Phytophthora cactorum]KAG2838829.1 hypothetical protein PC113_g19588 [Phytophthora cactorum]KAG2891658.1 hypothetical protein PC115_g19102 [Phytophthora cactorum]KAG2966146.1 hypothetical protein PC118_g19340 [Phytophthora cactorum]
MSRASSCPNFFAWSLQVFFRPARLTKTVLVSRAVLWQHDGNHNAKVVSPVTVPKPFVVRCRARGQFAWITFSIYPALDRVEMKRAVPVIVRIPLRRVLVMIEVLGVAGQHQKRSRLLRVMRNSLSSC